MENKKREFDVIIIGAGLVGLATAYQIKCDYPRKRVLVLEKANGVATHQSGHNSGVIHSGIYYKPGSLKARNCIEGYNLLVQFAQEYGIPFELCGKLIVATKPEELPILQSIYNHGMANGLRDLRVLQLEEFREIEPHVAGLKAIQVPQTGIIDYPALAKQLLALFSEQDGEIKFSEEVVAIRTFGEKVIVNTQKEEFVTKSIVTCGGLQSDRIAGMTEERNDLKIIPFRGEYYKLKPEREYLVKNLIYPVPDPNFPFLGVHFTRMINGGIEAGPNAVLAFKREGYKFSSFNLKDTFDTFTWPGFWKVVGKYGKTGLGEIYRSLSKSAFTKALQTLIPDVQEHDLVPGGAGVRAQACNRSGNLIDDFDILSSGKGNVIHVRNAPSPAATSCLAIGKTISSAIINHTV